MATNSAIWQCVSRGMIRYFKSTPSYNDVFYFILEISGCAKMAIRWFMQYDL